jgi:GNAT superfamily N-acetyltransferase
VLSSGLFEVVSSSTVTEQLPLMDQQGVHKNRFPQRTITVVKIRQVSRGFDFSVSPAPAIPEGKGREMAEVAVDADGNRIEVWALPVGAAGVPQYPGGELDEDEAKALVGSWGWVWQDAVDVWAEREVYGHADWDVKALDLPSVFDAVGFAAQLVADMKDLVLSTMLDAAQGLLAVTGVGVLAASARDLLGRLAERQAARMGGVAETTGRRVDEALVEGVAAGDTPTELAARVDEVFQSAIEVRAPMIAATEANAASNTARVAVAQDMNMQVDKIWWSRLDGRVRPAHRAAHGQQRQVQEPFDVGGFPMRFPHDPAAPPHLIINCRCIVLVVPVATVAGAPVPSILNTGFDEAARLGLTPPSGTVGLKSVQIAPLGVSHETKRGPGRRPPKATPAMLAGAERFRRQLGRDGPNQKPALPAIEADGFGGFGSDDALLEAFTVDLGPTPDGKGRVRAIATKVEHYPNLITIEGRIDAEGADAGKFLRSLKPDWGVVRHEDIVVAPEYRGHRYGTNYVAHMEQVYAAHGYHQIHLTAALESGPIVWAHAGYNWIAPPKPYREWAAEHGGPQGRRLAEKSTFSVSEFLDLGTAAEQFALDEGWNGYKDLPGRVKSLMGTRMFLRCLPRRETKVLGRRLNITREAASARTKLAWESRRRRAVPGPSVEEVRTAYRGHPHAAIVDFAVAHRADIVQHAGPEAVTAYVDAAHAYFGRSDVTVRVRVPAQTALTVLEDGFIRNGHETGNPNHVQFPPDPEEVLAWRRHVEDATQRGRRPVYGFTSTGSGDRYQHYGSVQFVLKDAVKDRSTVSIGDSLSAGTIPQPYRAMSTISADDLLNATGQLEWANETGLAFLWFRTRGQFADAAPEVQIEGPVPVDDVAGIVIDEEDTPAWLADAIRAAAARAGVTVAGKATKGHPGPAATIRAHQAWATRRRARIAAIPSAPSSSHHRGFAVAAGVVTEIVGGAGETRVTAPDGRYLGVVAYTRGPQTGGWSTRGAVIGPLARRWPTKEQAIDELAAFQLGKPVQTA